MIHRVYENKREGIRFDIKPTKHLVESLENLGYLDEGVFDVDKYYDNYYDENKLGGACDLLVDGVIDYYEDKVEREDEKVSEMEVKDEWYDMWNSYSDLEKILVMNDFDKFIDNRYVEAVKIVDVTGNPNPYNL